MGGLEVAILNEIGSAIDKALPVYEVEIWSEKHFFIKHLYLSKHSLRSINKLTGYSIARVKTILNQQYVCIRKRGRVRGKNYEKTR